MRLAIVDADALGLSYVRAIHELPDPDPSALVWEESGLDSVRAVIARIAPESALHRAEPPIGGFRWVYRLFPSGDPPPARDVGRHVTRTIDFDICVRGRMRCTLHHGEVDLVAGDLVVIRAANHAWRNIGDDDAAMLFLLHAPMSSAPRP